MSTGSSPQLLRLQPPPEVMPSHITKLPEMAWGISSRIERASRWRKGVLKRIKVSLDLWKNIDKSSVFSANTESLSAHPSQFQKIYKLWARYQMWKCYSVWDVPVFKAICLQKLWERSWQQNKNITVRKKKGKQDMNGFPKWSWDEKQSWAI